MSCFSQFSILSTANLILFAVDMFVEEQAIVNLSPLSKRWKAK